MDELSSTAFRKVYAKLKEPTVVTANGHWIGMWLPSGVTVTVAQLIDAGYEKDSVVDAVATGDLHRLRSAQDQRDELLRKINRSK